MPSTYKYTIVFSSSDGGSGTYKVWAKEDKFRLEMTVDDGGQSSTTIILINEGYDYVYMPEQNMAIQYPVESGASPAAAFYGFSAFFTGYYTVYYSDAVILSEWQAACSADPSCQSVSIAGHDSISGEACTIFEAVYTNGSTVRIWIATDRGWVMKVEDTVNGSTTTIEFSDIEFNPSIPDSLFELPEGVTIMTM
jgi:outer membrane lipoprotein-sorting protein